MVMSHMVITNQQARQFLLAKHGLLNEHIFEGPQGVLDYISQAGCIQFDPIDVCGKNPELVLQSRVRNFEKKMLYDLLYEDRKLIDYFDKNLAIMHVSDWPYFRRYRDSYRTYGKSSAAVEKVGDQVKNNIREKGPLCSRDLGLDEKISWYWSDTKLSRAALEQLYFTGDLVIHHKKGTGKYYDLAERHIPENLLHADDPCPDTFEHNKWRVLRRISSVGLLWSRPSDAWLNIYDLKAPDRKEIFSRLIDEKKILPVEVEGLSDILYYNSGDLPLMESILQNPPLKERCEFLAPLDNMLWDRKLIQALFGFDYKWEIYTPQDQRKYGYYVLPVLYRDRLVGRVEAVNNRKEKTLSVKNIWLEPGVTMTGKLRTAMTSGFRRLAAFNGSTAIEGALP
ncbi:winged helix DNA-binding domain-containing protein [Brucepastera parasyntrophica]|uniref:winged helix-turn-helix domain-containing protein n=1 Tax=Brucepastera parasyntrophica TaxID=2880008 RepID=UPI00210EB4E4|nr:crosslink repair DNA glycosylase YcaQ family protein [Brucepastera parasyntrophica]ULQ58624.1 winged helix DNA-binding domain-containing protein [Brucepastera parasyntrophica]